MAENNGNTGSRAAVSSFGALPFPTTRNVENEERASSEQVLKTGWKGRVAFSEKAEDAGRIAFIAEAEKDHADSLIRFIAETAEENSAPAFIEFLKDQVASDSDCAPPGEISFLSDLDPDKAAVALVVQFIDERLVVNGEILFGPEDEDKIVESIDFQLKKDKDDKDKEGDDAEEGEEEGIIFELEYEDMMMLYIQSDKDAEKAQQSKAEKPEASEAFDKDDDDDMSRWLNVR